MKNTNNRLFTILLCLLLGQSAIAASQPDSQEATSKQPGAATVEARLRVALAECYGLREQIEALELQDYRPDAIWLDSSQPITLLRGGFRSAPGAPDTYIWSGSSKNLVSRLETAVTIRFRLKASMEQVLARRPLQSNEILTEDALCVKKFPWKPTHSIAAARSLGLETFSGKLLTRSLAKDAVLLADYVSSPPLVQRGETVSLLVQGAGLAIRTEAVALQPGRAGELILLKRLDTGLQIRGVVKSPGVVQIQSYKLDRQNELLHERGELSHE